MIWPARGRINSVPLLAYRLPPWPTWLVGAPSTVSSHSPRVSLTHLFKVYRPADALCFPPPPLSQLSLSSPTNTNMHTHKGNQIDMHTPPPPTISQTPLVFASPRPPTSLCSLPFYPPPTSHLPRSLSRPEATAGTCMAGCYVGAMTTVMNSTWRSRIQADVSLCGCRASNGAHVSHE